jgi:hypothetical protein
MAGILAGPEYCQGGFNVQIFTGGELFRSGNARSNGGAAADPSAAVTRCAPPAAQISWPIARACNPAARRSWNALCAMNLNCRRPAAARSTRSRRQLPAPQRRLLHLNPATLRRPRSRPQLSRQQQKRRRLRQAGNPQLEHARRRHRLLHPQRPPNRRRHQARRQPWHRSGRYARCCREGRL